MPGHPYRAFLIMYGSGSNGKTQLQDVIEGFVGADNAAGVKLSALTGGDDFATGALPGKFVNIGDDESGGEIRDTSTLKSLTGGGTMRANVKHEKQYEFKNEAAMFFSANEPPRISEEKEAINDRLYLIEMPYQFKGANEYDPENPMHKRKEPNISERLLGDDEAMRGLLLLAVEHAQQLVESDGQYSMPEGPAERRLRYEGASDPIMRFLAECIKSAGENDGVLKDDAYTVYTSLCEAHNERTTDSDAFKRKITQQAVVDVENWRTQRLSGDQEMAWRYVRFSEVAAQYMPARLKERYTYVTGGDEVSVVEEDDQEEDLDDVNVTGSPVYGAVPITEAAETLTGYSTVTVEIVTADRLGEEEKGVKAVGKDQSGAIDIVAWDEPLTSRLEEIEGEHVVIKNAEVTEYDDIRQLSPVVGLTEIEQIQQGVGYTAGEPRDDGQGAFGSAAAADGGEFVDVVPRKLSICGARGDTRAGDEARYPPPSGGIVAFGYRLRPRWSGCRALSFHRAQLDPEGRTTAHRR